MAQRHRFFGPQTLVLLAVPLCLAACGGGGSSSGGSDTDDTASMATDPIERFIDENGEALNDFAVIDPDLIPDSGSVTYTGAILGQLDGQTLQSDLSVTSDFANNALTGDATNFTLDDTTTLSGTLEGNGDLDRTDGQTLPQLSIVLDGALDGQDSTFGLEGVFLTETGEAEIVAIGGQVEGFIGNDFLEDGIFAAE